jgi:hypothetical protein
MTEQRVPSPGVEQLAATRKSSIEEAPTLIPRKDNYREDWARQNQRPISKEDELWGLV